MEVFQKNRIGGSDGGISEKIESAEAMGLFFHMTEVVEIYSG